MRKKIFIVITRLDTGGSSEVVMTIKNSLSAKYDISILSGHGEQIPDILIPSLQRETSVFNDIFAFFELYSVFRQHKPDIVHLNSSKAGFIGRWAAWLCNQGAWVKGKGSRKIRILYMPHGHVFYGYGFSRLKTRLFILLEKLSAPITNTLIALTEGEKRESIEYGIGTREQWAVIHPGSDIPGIIRSKREEKRKEFGIPTDALVVGTVSRLDPVKGVIFLIRAFKDILAKYPEQAYLLIVGDGMLRRQVEDEAKILNIYDRCIFTGFRIDVYELLTAMDIYVQPSLNEGMGKTIVQAQAAGLPVIASNVQGIPDALKDRETGSLVPPGDTRAISETVNELLGNKSKRQKMGEAAAKWIREKKDGYPIFSTERMIFLINKLYEETLNK